MKDILYVEIFDKYRIVLPHQREVCQACSELKSHIFMLQEGVKNVTMEKKKWHDISQKDQTHLLGCFISCLNKEKYKTYRISRAIRSSSSSLFRSNSATR